MRHQSTRSSHFETQPSNSDRRHQKLQRTDDPFSLSWILEPPPPSPQPIGAHFRVQNIFAHECIASLKSVSSRRAYLAMSQLSQQAERPFDTQLHYLPQESSTADRTQIPHSANNSLPALETRKRYATSIHYWAASRCGHLHTRSRSLRKPAPSPLQTSTTPRSPSSSVTPTGTTFPVKGSEYQHAFTTTKPSQSPREEPRTPIERLDDLLATEKNFHTLEHSTRTPQIQDNSR